VTIRAICMAFLIALATTVARGQSGSLYRRAQAEALKAETAEKAGDAPARPRR